MVLAFTVPVKRRDQAPGKGLAEHLEHLIRPISAGVAVPIFAFFAAGVTIGGWTGIKEAFEDPVTLGVVFGLVVGKCVGITLATYLLARFTAPSSTTSWPGSTWSGWRCWGASASRSRC